MVKRKYFYRYRVWQEGMHKAESGVLEHRSVFVQPVKVVNAILKRGCDQFNTYPDKIEIVSIARL